MSAKGRKNANPRNANANNIVRNADDDRKVRNETHVPNVMKKNHSTKKNTKNTGMPAGYKIDDLPPVADQMNRPYIQQPYAMNDHTGNANLMQPMLIDHTNRPINMTVYPGAPPCWCSQYSNDMRAIREMVSAVSNGIHCILQKVHMDQVQNAEMMSRIMNTVDLIADTVTNLPIAQLQEYDQYVIDEIPPENTNGGPDDVDNTGPYFGPNDGQDPPGHHPGGGNFRRH